VRLQPHLSTSEPFNGVNVFSATTYRQRGAIGDVVTRWLAKHAAFRLCDLVVRQAVKAVVARLSICVIYRDVSGQPGAVR
jgi:hypothetical protein